ncbi:hypothetical protein BRADI_5g02900v3 [Brachypodium distachyon]|uniref:FAD-binding PCMH-type domain-containing protein n=1 Tax=Brachypodium distachyon TaxID=15368 RepID=A0A0Q3E287_BRADI|nr:hypothetical protein BRADI_5g02900v3 [Brachypodium distachyon]
MARTGRLAALVVSCIFLLYYVAAPSMASGAGFLQCLKTSIPSNLVLTRGSPSFEPVLVSSIRNAEQLGPAKANPPLSIVTPTNYSHVQSAVRCSARHGVRLRVRSGGHDYEGLSYRSTFTHDHEPFAVVDLFNLRHIMVDSVTPTPMAYVQSGATLGELYYAIGKQDPKLAFPAGLCPTIGVGGHLSGGGIGLMMRKYGISADNVIHATIVDAAGNLLEGREAMGEDLFWAIRGGGGGSFGIVQLSPVPPKVVFFQVAKTMAQGAARLVSKWQTVAPALPDDLSLRVLVVNRTVRFQGLYIGDGGCHEALKIMTQRFPELGATANDCREMSWLESTAYVYFGQFGNASTPVEALLNRTFPVGSFLKHKSDYVKTPIPEASWEKILSWPFGGATDGQLMLEPHGGSMGAAFKDFETPGPGPYPHRRGVLYNIHYIEVYSENLSTNPPSWITGLYDFMEPLVSSNPRSAYVNYRDLDIGVNKDGVASYESAKVWGERYFGAANFERLARIKAKVDPKNHFRHEQSVPLIF